MSRTDLHHWTMLLEKSASAEDLSTWHVRLVTAYSDPLRYYHNLQHLTECLTELDRARGLARNPVEIEIALWFHDAVYDSRSTSNEEDSADLAASFLINCTSSCDQVETIRRLVLSTKTHETGDDSDSALLIDIDLAVFGKPAERYLEYESGIRAEYAWVPEMIYREKRAETLERFLARPTIYRAPSFIRRYEIAARSNLSAAVAQLKQPF